MSGLKRDRIYTGVGVVFVAAALWLLLAGRGESVDLETLDAPALTLLSPQDGAVIGDSLVVEFDAGMRMAPVPRGWGDQTLHLHLAMNRREYMPGRNDIERLDGGRYRWTLPSFTEGTYQLRLVWATTDHGSIPHGASDEITIHIDPRGADRGSEPTPHH